jgi:hypothetical protein
VKPAAPATIDPKAIAWKPWADGLRNSVDSILSLAEEWLGDFGLALLPDSSSPPDGWAELDCNRWAFRFDSMGKSIIAIVTIEDDADCGDDGVFHDKSRCVRVEVVRGAP